MTDTEKTKKMIPCTILTGFLGAGKTTILNRILNEPHGYKIAVIENEFGEENIDGEILLHSRAEEFVEMNNGCLCCSTRGDLIDALTKLAKRRDINSLDRVVIETTGLADPGPIIHTFFVEDSVAENFIIDGIVTVVDSVYGMKQLDTTEEARRQIGFADKLILTKTDLATKEQVQDLRDRLIGINLRAPIITADLGKVALEEIFDINGFHLNDKLDFHTDSHDDTCTCSHCSRHVHSHHTEDVSTFSFTSNRPFYPELFEDFLATIVDLYGNQMFRYKGILYFNNVEHKIIFQGVHQLIGSDKGSLWSPNEEKKSKIVFIGKNLPKTIFLEGLTHCLL